LYIGSELHKAKLGWTRKNWIDATSYNKVWIELVWLQKRCYTTAFYQQRRLASMWSIVSLVSVLVIKTREILMTSND